MIKFVHLKLGLLVLYLWLLNLEDLCTCSNSRYLELTLRYSKLNIQLHIVYIFVTYEQLRCNMLIDYTLNGFQINNLLPSFYPRAHEACNTKYTKQSLNFELISILLYFNIFLNLSAGGYLYSFHQQLKQVTEVMHLAPLKCHSFHLRRTTSRNP